MNSNEARYIPVHLYQVRALAFAAQYSTRCRAHARFAKETDTYVVYISLFPRDIPPTITVPAWAFLDIENEDTFNATTAELLAGSLPDVLPLPPASTTTATQSTPTGSPNPSKAPDHGDNAGAIAGGVIGAVVGLALIFGLTFILFRSYYRRRRPAVSSSPPSITVDEAPRPQDPIRNYAASFAHYGPPPSGRSYGDDVSLRSLSLAPTT
ncbi:hypothetical protein FA13DRAFT_1867632 [Coprinellus micaceus]|uniref:Uncharacterized protein n=1 Tax=Coprinellus micaceus TaxID=71717 RepID=A0A4Y7TVF3_COPMI|nr:hypothetical protein FA13DRAFT_1867632 [Coprinellus micaceus]